MSYCWHELSSFEPGMLEGGLSARYLLAFQNEHCILITRLLTWAVYRFMEDVLPWRSAQLLDAVWRADGFATKEMKRLNQGPRGATTEPSPAQRHRAERP